MTSARMHSAIAPQLSRRISGDVGAIVCHLVVNPGLLGGEDANVAPSREGHSAGAIGGNPVYARDDVIILRNRASPGAIQGSP
jgi:hypothetical protein